ncbi:MAG: hypothetical protein AAFX04_10715 [Pseudomonadota bacterium]
MLLKSGRHEPLVQPVRALDSQDDMADRTAIDPDPEMTTLRRQNAALYEEIQALQQAQAQRETEYQRRCSEARETAYAEALEQAADDSAARLAQLAAMSADAVAQWRKTLAEMETLAVALACAAVEKIIGSGERKGEASAASLVIQALQLQLRQLQDTSLISITVSAKDFPDEAAVATLNDSMIADRCTIKTDALRPSGYCTIAMHLGSLDISLGEQTDALKALCRDMLAPGFVDDFPNKGDDDGHTVEPAS